MEGTVLEKVPVHCIASFLTRLVELFGSNSTMSYFFHKTEVRATIFDEVFDSFNKKLTNYS